MANDKYSYNDYSLEHVRNRHEIKVLEIMKGLIPETHDFCGCRICIEDVFALALNAIPPLYAHTASIVIRRDPPQPKDIARAVTDAIDRVRVRPNHDS